ncbi:hypothetical protein MW369_003433 [Vibrio parahaemolyticus]|nr:hypothetical protein [Vibrio parahaemolyticus]OOX39363.1 hypothetical protein BJL83_07435 [Vibrio parahaemolyticus]
MTTRIEVNQNDWTLISSAAAGFMENEGGSIIKYRVEDTKPDALEKWGHSLKREKGIGWSRAVAKPIYARSVTAKSNLIVTEG